MKGVGSSASRQTSERKRSKFLLLFLLLFLIACGEPPPSQQAAVLPPQSSYYESLATEEERILYQAILQAVNTANEIDVEFDLDGREEELVRISRMVLYDHPSLSGRWVSHKLSVKNGHLIQARMDGSDMLAACWYRILALICEQSSDLETARAVFLFLASHCQYDVSGALYSGTDYGAVSTGKATCQGASFAFKRAMDAYGIPCVVVTSYTERGDYHMFPLLELDSTWYACDLSSALGSDQPETYFLLTKEQLKRIATTWVMAPNPP